jgi:yecA family protein
MPGISRRLKLLEKLLVALPADNDPMLLSELDGYLAGILVCPDLIAPSEWLPLVWGGQHEDAAPVFENAGQAETLTKLVMEHYDAIADVLYHRPGYYAPVFDIDTRYNDILWELWVEGFDKAMQLRPDIWRRWPAVDEDTEVALAGFATLAAIARKFASGIEDRRTDRKGARSDPLLDRSAQPLAHRPAHHRWPVASAGPRGEGRPQRSMPLRLRREIQEMLRPQ